MKKVSKLLPVMFLLLIIFGAILCSKNVEVIVSYDLEAGVEPQGVATLYYSNGSPFSEENSDYKTIENGTAAFSFRTFLPVRQLRIQPIKKEGQTAYVKSVEIFLNGEKIHALESEELYEALLPEQEGSDVTLTDHHIVIAHKETNPWCYVDFQPDFVESINQYTVQTGLYMILFAAMFLLPAVILYLCKKGRRYPVYEKMQKYGSSLSFCVSLLLLWFLQKWLGAAGVFLLWLCPFFFWNGFGKEKKKKFQYLADYLAVAFSAAILVCSRDIFRGMIEGIYQWKIDYIFLVICGWTGGIAFWDLLHTQKDQETVEEEPKWLFVNPRNMIAAFVCICVTFLLYEYIKSGLDSSLWHSRAELNRLLIRFFSPVYLMNLLWGVLFLWALVSFLGKGIGFAIYMILYLVLLAGNVIKIVFHNTLLTPLDFMQLREAYKIAQTMLGTTTFYIILVLAAVLVVGGIALAVIFRKKWMSRLRFSPSWPCVIVCTLVAACLTRNVIHEVYKDRDIFYKGYANEFVNEDRDGFAFYNLINLSKINEIFMSAPDGYSEAYIENIKKSFPAVEKNQNETSPNVILIMAESAFDIENIPEITFNQEIEPTLRAHKKGTLISPRYGGYTSAVEYEALTGLSLAYYPSAMVPYTTYFNSADKKIPSIASEFGKNGYQTYAIHPNDKTFYNRDSAYRVMGFDEFLDVSAFTRNAENVVAGTYLKDQPIADKIKTLIEQDENPVFTFAVTIAGHYMNEDRYASTEIKASSDVLNASELHEIEQQATSLQETDRMFQDLIAYVEQSEEPTLLYIFGDHLPPLPAFEKLNYLQEPSQKYGTSLAAYSNCTEIEFPDYVTPNQIAAQIMHDSGIDHSSYFDYIYSLQKTYPVIHKEFCDVENNPNLETYRTIQYDIMFGKQYFYENGA